MVKVRDVQRAVPGQLNVVSCRATDRWAATGHRA